MGVLGHTPASDRTAHSSEQDTWGETPQSGIIGAGLRVPGRRDRGHHLQAIGNSGGGLFGRDDWMDFEVDDVVPVCDPLLQKSGIGGFHYLEAALEFLVDPARNILQALWSQSPAIAKSPVEGNGSAFLKCSTIMNSMR